MAVGDLHNLAEQVFGAGWQSKLARHIDANPRTVRRWASGDILTPKVVILYLQLLIKVNEARPPTEKTPPRTSHN